MIRSTIPSGKAIDIVRYRLKLHLKGICPYPKESFFKERQAKADFKRLTGCLTEREVKLHCLKMLRMHYSNCPSAYAHPVRSKVAEHLVFKVEISRD